MNKRARVPCVCVCFAYMWISIFVLVCSGGGGRALVSVTNSPPPLILCLTDRPFLFSFPPSFHRSSNTQLHSQGADKLWWQVCACQLLFSFYVTNTYVTFAIGLQWVSAWAYMVILWGFAAPAVYFFAIHNKGGLEAVWECTNTAFVVIVLFGFGLFLRFDWQAYAEEATNREEKAKEVHVSKTATVGEAMLNKLVELVADETTPILIV